MSIREPRSEKQQEKKKPWQYQDWTKVKYYQIISFNNLNFPSYLLIFRKQSKVFILQFIFLCLISWRNIILFDYGNIMIFKAIHCMKIKCFFSAIRWEPWSIQADTWCLPTADTTVDTTRTVDTTVVMTVDMTVVITVDMTVVIPVDKTVNMTTDMTGVIPTLEIMRGLALGKWEKINQLFVSLLFRITRTLH